MAVSWESKKLYSVGEPPLLPKHNDEVVEKKKEEKQSNIIKHLMNSRLRKFLLLALLPY